MIYQKFLKGSIATILLAAFIFTGVEWIVDVQKALAIPAFARKYDFTCNVCHVPGFPKLNDFGNLFRDRGYQLGSDADLPLYEGITMGYWPVSFRTTVGYQAASVRTDGTGITTSGVGFTGLDILSFGILERNVAFRIVYTPGLADAGFGVASTAGDGDLESAQVRFMQLERFFGVKSKPGDYLLNLGVGKFEIDVPFSEKRSPSLNTPMVMYHYMAGTPYTATISGTSTSSYANPNSFGLGDNQPGFELTGIKKTNFTNGYFRYSLSALATNTFSGALSGCPAGTSCGTGGTNFNFYGHATQSFGGYGIVTGHRVGVFGAYGQAPTVVNATCPTCPGVGGSGQPFYRIGADLSLTYKGQVNLFGAFMHGNDSKNLFQSQGIANARNASWNGAFVELDVYPTLLPVLNMPDWFFSYRFDIIRNSRQGDPTFSKSYNDVDSHTFVIRYFLFQHSRGEMAIHAEYNNYRTKNVGTGGGDLLGQTFLVGFDFAY